MNFTCPYCQAPGNCPNLPDEVHHTFGAVVCEACGGYVARVGGQWHALPYELLGEIHRRAPMLLAGLEAQRVKLIEAWLKHDPFPPTVFAATMTNMVRARGWGVVLWRPK